MINQNFIYLGSLLNLIGSGIYIRDTLRGKTRPNRVSWFVLAIAPLVAFAAMISQGIGFRQSLMTFTIGLSPLLIFISSFVTKYASWRIRPFDLACGGLALAGLGLWGITRVGNLAILFGLLADLLAFLPTLVKAFAHPETESWQLFGLAFFNGAIALLIINRWDFAHAAFPIYLFIADLIMVLLARFRLGLKILAVLHKSEANIK